MDFNDSLDQLNIQLGDTGDTTFTPEEKTRALTKAWNDSYVVEEVWDTSLTFSQTTYRYAVPAALTTVKDIYINPSNSTADEPEKIASDFYEIVDGYIQFKNGAQNTIPQGWSLYLRGNYKLTISDTITNVNLQEYVIALAGYETLTLLGYKKANLFLKNDTSMAELIGLRREFKNDIREYRQKLPKSYEVA